MEIQIKKAVKAGNSSAVILPRSWLNKDVRVELVKKTPEIILSEVIDIAKKYIEINGIVGVYLTGSYAREEEDDNSDIDILIITENIDKEIIQDGIYNILIISLELLHQKLKNNLFPIGQMLREAKPLLNSNYLGSLEIKVTKSNIKWYLDTTEDKIKLIHKVIHKIKKSRKSLLDDQIAYTLVLRIRTMLIIKKMLKNDDYSKKEFIRIIEKISKGKTAYERYIAVKNNMKTREAINIEGVELLCKYLEKQLTEVKKLIGYV